MATKKETKEKESTIKPKETKREKLTETPIPDPEPLPEGVVAGEPDILPKDEIDEMIETPVSDPVDMIMDEKEEIKEVEPILEAKPDKWVTTPEPLPEAKPEKLGTVVIDEGIEKAKGEKEELKMVTTADLKPPKRGKAKKAHDAANDIIITTHDFKPRTWGESKKL